jgi:hypothetical protein
VRTTSRTVTFVHPFNLSGTDEVQPAGTYTVQTDEELLQASSIPPYRRITTLPRLDRTTGMVLTQIGETQIRWNSRGPQRETRSPTKRRLNKLTAKLSCLGKERVAGSNLSAKAGNIGLPSTPLI